MSILVRKVERGKWEQNDIRNGAEVSADAITACMKTKGNKLSVWEVDNDCRVVDAVLAMVATSDHLDTIDVISLDKAELTEAGLKLIDSPGDTPVKHLVNTHRDIDELTYRGLGLLAGFHVEAFKHSKAIRYRKAELQKILLEAISNGQLAKDDLKDSIRDKI